MATGSTSQVESVRVSATGGRLTVVAEARRDVLVSGASLHQEGGRATVDGGSGRVEVRVPAGVDLVVGTHSGRVQVDGPVGAVAVVTESGRVSVAQAESVDVRTSSGRVEIGEVDGDTRARSDSGRITVRRTVGADVATSSGRIELRSVSGSTRAHCVSGRIEIRIDAPTDVEVETVSGRITLHIADHLRDACAIATRTVSGRVSVVPTR
jgi:DUF4097 and DUF4098 domain-containing protein YvlB